METNIDFKELLALCREFIAQDEASICLADQTTYDYLKEHARKNRKTTPKPETKLVPPIPKIEPQEIKPKTVATQIKIAEAKPEVKSEPKQVVKAEPIQQNPSQPLMPRPFTPQALPPFESLREKIIKIAPNLPLNAEILSDSEAQIKSSNWKLNYPKFAILSFFAATSKEHAFLKNVASAIHSRLIPCALYEANSATNQEIIILAESMHLQTLLLAIDPQALGKATDFLAHLNLQKNQKETSLLTSKGALYKTQVFELLVTNDTQTANNKALLWKTLTHLVKSV